MPQRLPFLQSLHFDSFDRLWAGTIYGLYAWEPGPPTANGPPLRPGAPHRFLLSDGEPHSINAEQVYQIYEDRNQLLWLGTAAGRINWLNLHKSVTGQTAVEFIRDVRMKRAAQLLTQTQMRVSEVAFQVGIMDEKYFRKTFPKIYGVVPSEHIRQHRPSREVSNPPS